MAYGIGKAARFARLITGGAARRDTPKSALILRVENGDQLRASIGPVLLDRMMDVLAMRLGTELRLLPRGRMPGQTVLCGLLAARTEALPGLLAQLGAICRSSIDLGDLRMTPVINAVIVSDMAGAADAAALWAYGHRAIRACSPLAETGQIRFVEYSGVDSQQVSQAKPLFSPEQIRTCFQPQLCCDTGRILGLRVVGRVDHPELGALDLHDLRVRLDEQTLAEVFRITLRLSLAALRGWDRLGRDLPFVSLSMSDRELADPTLAEAVLWELDRLDLAPARLEIEVTEPIGRSGGRMPVTASLQRLSAAGCRIALGDFGTGSAGLDTLRMFGIRRVRIGRGFVAGCDHRADQQRMILAVLALAEHLKLQTLACGVATLDERAFLAQIGFDAVQGKAVAPILSATELDDFLQSHDLALPPPFVVPRKA